MGASQIHRELDTIFCYRTSSMSDDLSKPDAERPLATLVERALERYFEDLKGQPPSGLYELTIRQVERPLLEIILRESGGNISKAAQALGMNRATLRKKLAKYGVKRK